MRTRLFQTIMATAMLCAVPMTGQAGDPGLFRTRIADAPDRGVLRMSGTSYYSEIPINSILTDTYGVTNSRIFSGITQFELGVTSFFTIDGALPYYMDLFSQQGRSGDKTGAGDVVLGMRISRNTAESMVSGVSLGARVRIPEQLGYGPEPLGFRTFSHGKLAWSVDAAAGFRLSRADLNLSVSMIQFPVDAKADTAYSSDAFYDTGFGYLGIGQPDATGLAEGLFQNQLHASAGFSVPVKPWLAALVEFNATSFIENPVRDPIMTLAPGFRIGSSEGMNLSVGIDYALGGPIPDRTVLVRFRVPTLSYRGIRDLLTGRRIVRDVRSQNARLAFTDFTQSGSTYLYERELKQRLLSDLAAEGTVGIVSDSQVAAIMQQRDLVPIAESEQQLGIRLGANYLINTEILDYQVSRTSDFTIPYLIGFPQTGFDLTCRASVTDLVTGEDHTLGIITASVVRPRGVSMFPTGPSSDIEFLSAPERRTAEKELIDRWVEQFNQLMVEQSSIFGWEPRRSDVVGDDGTALE